MTASHSIRSMQQACQPHQEVEGQVTGGIPQDGLLDEQHVAARLGNLLDQLQSVVALLLQDPAG